MIGFENSALTVSNNSVIAGTEFGDNVAKLIAKAVADGKLDTIGIEKDMEDDGNGGLQESGQFEIVNEKLFADFIAANANMKIKAAAAPQPANNSAAKVWLKNDTGVVELPRTTTKVTGKVLRYHVSMLDGRALGLSITFQTVINGIVKNDNTALISADYLKPILKNEATAANMLNWADKELKEAVIILGSRTTIAGQTAYFREQAKLNELEKAAFKAVTNKSDIKMNDRGYIGFVHRVSNTSYTFTSVASATEKLQFDTMVSRLSELSIKVTEKEALDNVELKTLGERNRIETETIEHHINTAKRMLANGVITTEQFNTRVSNLLEKYGM